MEEVSEENLKGLLEERIKRDSTVVSKNMINVAGFINHQVDMKIIDAIGKLFASKFENEGINKVLTVEASGIPPACFTAYYLNTPMLYAKKKLPKTLGSDVYFREAYSVTRGEKIPLAISKRYLNEGDRVLIVDDFLASGATCVAMVDMLKEAKATFCGFCAIIEKVFESGRKRLMENDIKDVYSIVKIKKMEEEVEFEDEKNKF